MPKSRFVIFAGREFELVTVWPRPRGDSGETCQVFIDLTYQRIEVAGEVPKDQRMTLVREAEAEFLSAGRRAISASA